MKLVYIETLKQIPIIVEKTLNTEKFIRFRDTLVISRSLLQIIISQKQS